MEAQQLADFNHGDPTYRLRQKVRDQIARSAVVVIGTHFLFFCLGGEVPMTLTWGEMIGLGVASVILFALFITGCLMMRKRSKESTHSRAQLV